MIFTIFIFTSFVFKYFQFVLPLFEFFFQQLLIVNRMKYQSKLRSPKKPTASNQNHQQKSELPPSPVKNSSQVASQKTITKKSITYFKNQNRSINAFKQKMSRTQQLKEGNLFSKPDSSRMDKMGALLGNIMSKHKQMKKKIQRLKRQKENKELASVMQLSFQPKIRQNPRYRIQAPIGERNKSWDQARAQHFTSIRQQIVQNQIKECTFSPHFVSKPKSQKYLKDKEIKKQIVRQGGDREEGGKWENKFIRMGELSPNFKMAKKQPKSTIDIFSIKSMIKSQISRIAFNF